MLRSLLRRIQFNPPTQSTVVIDQLMLSTVCEGLAGCEAAAASRVCLPIDKRRISVRSHTNISPHNSVLHYYVIQTRNQEVSRGGGGANKPTPCHPKSFIKMSNKGFVTTQRYMWMEFRLRTCDTRCVEVASDTLVHHSLTY